MTVIDSKFSGESCGICEKEGKGPCILSLSPQEELEEMG